MDGREELFSVLGSIRGYLSDLANLVRVQDLREQRVSFFLLLSLFFPHFLFLLLLILPLFSYKSYLSAYFGVSTKCDLTSSNHPIKVPVLNE